MKSIVLKVFTLVIFLGFGLTSCEDFLEEDNRDSLTLDNFYSSDGQAVLAVNGVYRRIFADNAIYGDIRGVNLFIRLGADDMGHAKVTGNNTNNLVMGAYTITETNNEEVEQVWNQGYAGIFAANLVIEGITANRGNLSEEIANRSIGEAIFLRAFIYYHLTNLWGDVPFYDGSTLVAENARVGRIDKTIIREAQIRELTRIEEEGLLSLESYTGPDRGRATLAAAKMLKAKYMMWLGDYSGALAEAEDIINSGAHSLLPNFSDVFNTGQEQSEATIYHDENIFGYDFSATVEAGNINGDKTWRLFTPNANEEPGGFGGMEFPDGVGFTRGTSILTVRPSFVARFPEGPRKEASFSDGTDVSTNNVAFPSGMTYLEKLWSTNPVVEGGGRNGDFLVIFRYADLLLMAAEAASELGDDSKARGYLEQIQQRGNGTFFVPSNASGQALVQEIRDERGYELAGEGFRRYDLIRWGVLVETVRGLSPMPPANHDPASNIQDFHVLLPIAPEEFILNPVLLESDPTNNGYR